MSSLHNKIPFVEKRISKHFVLCLEKKVQRTHSRSQMKKLEKQIPPNKQGAVYHERNR